jgi:hypothetical protein
MHVCECVRLLARACMASCTGVSHRNVRRLVPKDMVLHAAEHMSGDQIVWRGSGFGDGLGLSGEQIVWQTPRPSPNNLIATQTPNFGEDLGLAVNRACELRWNGAKAVSQNDNLLVLAV